jgi:hypothetical protein
MARRAGTLVLGLWASWRCIRIRIGGRCTPPPSRNSAAYARTGAAVKSEEDPVDASPAGAMRVTVAAIRHLEAAVLGGTWTAGVVLRYG